MRAALAGLVLAFALISPASAQDMSETPQIRCGVDWKPAFLFEPGTAVPDRWAKPMIAEVIRLARSCRYRRLRIVAFRSNAGDEQAVARANALREMLLNANWPTQNLEAEFRWSAAAPTGRDYKDLFQSDAIVEFTDPDPNWHRDPKQNQICDAQGCSSHGRQPPLFIHVPWPPAAIHMPMLFFAAASATLDHDAQTITNVAASLLKTLNCRVLGVDGFADAAEADPEKLSLQRATATRDFLIESGVEPAAITIQGLGTKAPLALPSESAALNRRVTFECED
ncbi:MAG TPA: OmpA family protein [Rhizomicrobium sp.]|jgi:outer membrane protein OmpA-like peptidoglycan-associated protein